MKTHFVIVIGENNMRNIIARCVATELRAGILQPLMVITDTFDAPLKHFIATALGESYGDMNKDKARLEMYGYTITQFMALMKDSLQQQYGEGVFGKWLYNRVLRFPERKPDFVVVEATERDKDDVQVLSTCEADLIHLSADTLVGMQLGVKHHMIGVAGLNALAVHAESAKVARNILSRK